MNASEHARVIRLLCNGRQCRPTNTQRTTATKMFAIKDRVRERERENARRPEPFRTERRLYVYMNHTNIARTDNIGAI